LKYSGCKGGIWVVTKDFRGNVLKNRNRQFSNKKEGKGNLLPEGKFVGRSEEEKKFKKNQFQHIKKGNN